MIALYMLVAGVLFGFDMYVYARSVQRATGTRPSTDSGTSRMVSGLVNQARVSGDLAAKIMPLNIRSGHEKEDLKLDGD